MNMQEYRKQYLAGRKPVGEFVQKEFSDEKLLLSLTDYIYTNRNESLLERMSHPELINFFREFTKSIGLSVEQSRLTATELKHWAQENESILREREERLASLECQLAERDGELLDLGRQMEEQREKFSQQLVMLEKKIEERDQIVVNLNQAIADLEQAMEAGKRDQQLVELSDRFLELDKRIEERDEQMEELGELLSGKYNEDALELANQIKERDEQITAQARLLSDQQERTKCTDQQLGIKLRELEKAQVLVSDIHSQYEQLIIEFRQQLEQVYSSRSWRVTKPLRSLMMKLRGNKGDAANPMGFPEQIGRLDIEKSIGSIAISGTPPDQEDNQHRTRGQNVISRSPFEAEANGTTHVFTSVNACYIPKARAMAQSIKEVRPDLKIHLLLSDRLPDWYGENEEPFDSVILLEDLPIPDSRQWIFRHSLVELCTAVKGYGFREIFRRYGCDKVLYFDPDAVIFGGLEELEKRLNENSILLTPHQLVPENNHEAIVDNEICSLKHGIYNLGFLGVRGTDTGFRFLDWWIDRLHDYCYDDISGGLFTDQRWVDLAIAFFDDICILREPNFNVATWNLTHRVASGSLKEGIKINGRPLAFFHFSGFDSGAQEVMLRKYGQDSPALFQLREWYLRRLDECGQNTVGDTPWEYACFENGKRITKKHRFIYRNRKDLQKAFPDPFSVPEGKDNFYNWFLRGKEENGDEWRTGDELRDELCSLRSEIDQVYNSKSWRLARSLASIAKFQWLPTNIVRRS
ncbi:MAG: hypothetical protein V3S33_06800 [Gammaproteobacteria bacterium]